MPKRIFVGNYKGGVGKTTTVFQIGAGLSSDHGKKVLLIDLDPQCSLTKICHQKSGRDGSILSVEETLNYALELYGEYVGNATRQQVLEGKIASNFSSVDSFIKDIPKHEGLQYIPTALDMKNSRINDIADRYSSNKSNVLIVAKLLNDIEENHDFDYILVDCPPTSNIIIQSVFLYCDFYLIPTIGDELSTDGVTDYITEIESTYLKFAYDNSVGGIILKKYFAERPKLLGILETLYKNRAYATDRNSGNHFRKFDNLESLKNLDAAISKAIDYKSIISNNQELKYDETDNIFRTLIRNLDNRSDPRKHGIPITVSTGEIHSEYKTITSMVEQITR
ncbi:MAG: ParA family protein [Defluviitaleaceae bacterium]|nr:ParA family protein [Defluviitaleaceae bacterium]